MFRYHFSLEEGRVFSVTVDPDKSDAPAKLPSWTALEDHTCTNCPLDPADALCPAAVDLVEVVEAFANVASTARVLVRVSGPERTYEKACDAQVALGSLVGLVMAMSACPILRKMRPMAKTHLPFANVDETIVRTTSMYLLEQHLIERDGGEPDYALDGLRDLYGELHVLNTCFAKRLGAAAQEDANLNAVARLFSLSALVSLSLDDGLKASRGVFDR